MYNKRVISVDWLSISAKCYQSLDEYIPYDNKASVRPYYLKKTNVINPIFTFSFEVTNGNYTIGFLAWRPVSPVIRKDLVYFKLDNQLLYVSDWANELDHVIRFFRLTDVILNRMDICYDCNRFYGNRRPEKFINEYVSIPFEQEKAISREGSNKFYLIGNKRKQSSITYDYIRFGSPKSNVSAYIYNKSKELTEVADKPYIRELWEKAGLVNTDDIPVYRAEISVTGSDLNVVQLQTGEIFSISMDKFLNGLYVVDLFFCFSDKYLSFKQNNGNKKMKDWKRMTIFERPNRTNYAITRVRKKSINIRTEKILVNAISDIIENTNDLSNVEQKSLLLTRGLIVDRASYNHLLLRTELEANALNTFLGGSTRECNRLTKLELIREAEQRLQEELDELAMRREIGM